VLVCDGLLLAVGAAESDGELVMDGVGASELDALLLAVPLAVGRLVPVTVRVLDDDVRDPLVR
jgi:hypothetical protein